MPAKKTTVEEKIAAVKKTATKKAAETKKAVDKKVKTAKKAVASAEKKVAKKVVATEKKAVAKGKKIEKAAVKKVAATEKKVVKAVTGKKTTAKRGTIDFVQLMFDKAKAYQKALVLPEGTEERTVKAAAKIVSKKLASSVTLLGAPSEIQKVAADLKVNLKGITLVNPAESEWLDDFGKTYFELRQGKINKKTGQAEVPDVETGKAIMVKDFISFGAMMVKKGYADAMVSGAKAATADMLRAGLKVIGTESKTASSCFVMDTHNPKWGYKGLMIFSDCAVVPEPDAEALSDIAVASAKSCRSLLGCEPVVAMLSFSTKGSGGKIPSVVTVQEATKLAHEKAPDLALDGEFQADAALIPEVTEKKAPGSPITGKVNTIVFPNLGAGNIGYKLVQRLAGADAYGPVLQGFKQPISDLSRGCSVDDIVVTSAITLVQAGSAS